MVYNVDGSLASKASDLPLHLQQSTVATYKQGQEIYMSASQRIENPEALFTFTSEDVKAIVANMGTTLLATKPYLQ